MSIVNGWLIMELGLCSSTPRGDGNFEFFTLTPITSRKVYAAQPREGTETFLITQALE